MKICKLFRKETMAKVVVVVEGLTLPGWASSQWALAWLVGWPAPCGNRIL